MGEFATLGGGCYWCLDAFYRRIQGIETVVSGFAGGHTAHPTYEEVCGGTTGHAEVVQLQFDPDVISYRDILEIFFAMHDPTTPNQQGNDIGTQYRSIIFYHSKAQQAVAEDMIKHLVPTLYQDPAVTQLEPFTVFYPGPEYHQDFYSQNPSQGYCMMVIDPKLQKLRQKFAKQLRTDIEC